MAANLALDAKHALVVLNRLAGRRGDETYLLKRAMASDQRLDALAAIAIEVGAETGDPIGVVLADRLEASPEAWSAETLYSTLPSQTVALREVASVVIRQLLQLSKKKAESVGADFDPTVAQHTANLAKRLRELGRTADAAIAAADAVEMHRGLARGVPERVPQLAVALHNSALMLMDLGRYDQAIATEDEAIALRRELASKHGSDDSLHDLAMSLSARALMLRETLRKDEALAAAMEAVGIRRQLPQSWSNGFATELAAALTNLAMMLSDVGRDEEAWVAADQAVQLYRELSGALPDSVMPDLAASLNNAAAILKLLGRQSEATIAAGEAVLHYRELVHARPAAFQRAFGLALCNLGTCLAEDNRLEDAIVALSEGVSIWREIARNQPEASVAVLALGLYHLQRVLRILSREGEAWLLADEAMRRLVPYYRSSPHVFGNLMAAVSESYSALCDELQRTPETDLAEAMKSSRRDLGPLQQ